MHFLTGGLSYILPFLIVITPLVLVHELGHYLVARWSGVRVEIFSIGFGPEIFGWNDRSGTRWRLSLLPLGGYVKMYGDAGPASNPDDQAIREMSPEEKAVSLHYKSPGIRSAIVAAGPITNFIFPIVVFAIMYMAYGKPFTPPDIGLVVPNSAAAEAGLKVGDRIVAVDGARIESFQDLAQAVGMNTGTPLALRVRRGDAEVELHATPKVSVLTDRFGNKHSQGMLGVERDGVSYVHLNPADAVLQACGETWSVTRSTLTGLWQMIIGARPSDEIGGPLRIAKLSGDVAKGGALSLISLMALLSINLGLINLFPIPILDGGHLVFYAAEALRGRPLGQRAQEIGFRIGLAFVLTLMVFATWNDLVQLNVVAFIKGLVT